jgi:hypothetical protein
MEECVYNSPSVREEVRRILGRWGLTPLDMRDASHVLGKLNRADQRSWNLFSTLNRGVYTDEEMYSRYKECNKSLLVPLRLCISYLDTMIVSRRFSF